MFLALVRIPVHYSPRIFSVETLITLVTSFSVYRRAFYASVNVLLMCNTNLTPASGRRSSIALADREIQVSPTQCRCFFA